jgi:hypothetical protein
MGNRPSGDVDLFTSWQHRGEFSELTAAAVAALEGAGYKVSVIMSAETFTRLTLASPEGGGVSSSPPTPARRSRRKSEVPLRAADGLLLARASYNSPRARTEQYRKGGS